jgi:hypothetical protein
MLKKEKVIHTCWVYCTISVETWLQVWRTKTARLTSQCIPFNMQISYWMLCWQTLVASHTRPDTSIPLQPPTTLLLCFGCSKQLFAAALHSKFKTTAYFLPSARFSICTLFLSLMSTFLPEKIAVWQLLSSTTNSAILHWCPLFPCSPLHSAVILQHLANC